MSRFVKEVTLKIAEKEFAEGLNLIYFALYLVKSVSVDRILRGLQRTNFERIGFDPVLAKDLMSKESGRKSVMKAIDRGVTNNSIEFSKEIEKNEITFLEVAVIGTSLAAVESAELTKDGAKLTFISAERKLGVPWRYRFFLANSSIGENEAIFNKSFGVDIRAPFQKKGTTPVSPAGYSFFATPEGVITEDRVCVTCSDGSIRDYPWGNILGECIAFNIFSIGTNYLMETEIDLDSVKRYDDGRVFFQTVSKVDGKRNNFVCDRLVFATGPGVDAVNYSVEGTSNLFTKAVDSTIRANRIFIAEGKSPMKIKLPRLLNLPTVEMLLGYWVDDLNSDPEMYPFNELFADENMTWVYGGGGDGSRVLVEFGLGKFHKNAYPPEIYNRITSAEFKKKLKLSGINVPFFTKSGYNGNGERGRYDKIIGPAVDGMDITGVMGNIEQLKFDPDGLVVMKLKDNTILSGGDYTFVSTGIAPMNVRDRLRNSGFRKLFLRYNSITEQPEVSEFDIETSINTNLGTIMVDSGRFSDVARILFLGACDSIRPSGIIKRLLDLIKINENTIAAWYRTLCAEFVVNFCVSRNFQINAFVRRSRNPYEEIEETNFSKIINYPEASYEFDRLPYIYNPSYRQPEYQSLQSVYLEGLVDQPRIENKIIIEERFDDGINFQKPLDVGVFNTSVEESPFVYREEKYVPNDPITNLQLMIALLFAKLTYAFRRR